MALGLVTIGALLIAVEFNRPGRVLPGACGLFLVLTGLHRVWAWMGWHASVPWMALGGLGLIGLMRWRLLLGVPGVLGTLLLTTALVVLARRSGGALDARLALLCGMVLGLTTSCLMVLAGRAWRAKAGHRGASAERARTHAAERWGVD